MLLNVDANALNWPETREALDEFIAAFDAGTWPRNRWDHRAHLVMAAHFVVSLPAPEATQRIRAGIVHYNRCQGIANTDTSGYHETLTLFWIAMVQERRHGYATADHVTQIASIASELAGQRDLWREYYSTDIVRDPQARARWIEPDRRPLPVTETD